MKTIIISDLHNRTYWIEEALSSSLLNLYDNVVFLGDYFDDFNDTSKDIVRSAQWLKQSISKPNRIHLMGTHDMWYRFPFNHHLIASGNTPEKSKIINEILTKEDWSKLKLYHFEQNFLMTHAGLHLYFIDEYIHKNCLEFLNDVQITRESIVNIIVKKSLEEAMIDVNDGEINSWLDAGEARQGFQEIGGITWLDWNHEFEPIPNLNQIVGHTTFEYPQEMHTSNSKNYNLDTKNNHICILENGKFSYIKNIFL